MGEGEKMKRFLFFVILGTILIGIGSGLLLFQLRNDTNVFTEIEAILNNWFFK